MASYYPCIAVVLLAEGAVLKALCLWYIVVLRLSNQKVRVDLNHEQVTYFGMAVWAFHFHAKHSLLLQT
jgi:hypothetical protein